MADVIKKADVEDGEPPVARRRVSPMQFFQEVRREMSKVTWPSWKETWLTTVMVSHRGWPDHGVLRVCGFRP